MQADTICHLIPLVCSNGLTTSIWPVTLRQATFLRQIYRSLYMDATLPLVPDGLGLSTAFCTAHRSNCLTRLDTAFLGERLITVSPLSYTRDYKTWTRRTFTVFSTSKGLSAPPPPPLPDPSSSCSNQLSALVPTLCCGVSAVEQVLCNGGQTLRNA